MGGICLLNGSWTGLFIQTFFVVFVFMGFSRFYRKFTRVVVKGL